MKSIVNWSRQVIENFKKNPLNIKTEDVDKVTKEIDVLRGKERVQFYFEMIEDKLPAAEEEYRQRTSFITEEELLERQKELHLLMSVLDN